MTESVDDIVCNALQNLIDTGFKHTAQYVTDHECFITAVNTQNLINGKIKNYVLIDFETPLITNGKAFHDYSLELYYEMRSIKKWYRC